MSMYYIMYIIHPYTRVAHVSTPEPIHQHWTIANSTTLCIERMTHNHHTLDAFEYYSAPLHNRNSLHFTAHLRILLRSYSICEPSDQPLLVIYLVSNLYYVLCVMCYSHCGLHATKPYQIITWHDPSAGSPTETLLRLVLPLKRRVWPVST